LILIGEYLLSIKSFLVSEVIEISKLFLMLIFKLLRFLKNLAGEGFIIVVPFAICSISFQVRVFLSIPENTE
jgi:hypothetical protein